MLTATLRRFVAIDPTDPHLRMIALDIVNAFVPEDGNPPASTDIEPPSQENLVTLRLRRATRDGRGDIEVPLADILRARGLDDALRALACVQGHEKALILYACACVRRALYVFEQRHPGDKRPQQAVTAVEHFLSGRVPAGEIEAAGRRLRRFRGYSPHNIRSIAHLVVAAADHARQAATDRAEAGYYAGRAVRLAAEAVRVVPGGICRGFSLGNMWFNLENRNPWRVLHAGKEALAFFEREFFKLCALQGRYGKADRPEDQASFEGVDL